MVIAIEREHRGGAGAVLDEMRDRTAHAEAIDERRRATERGLALGKLAGGDIFVEQIERARADRITAAREQQLCRVADV